MIVSEALIRAAAALEAAAVDAPRLEARLLLEWAMRARREDLAREPEILLTPRQELIFKKAVALRAERRPLPYITGEGWFYGRPYKVNRATLIPRPETEILVQKALELIKDVPNSLVADIGTGSGCIAITLALEKAQSHVYATDISDLALRIATKNAARYSVSSRVTLCQGDLLAALPMDTLFDVLVSNPPYISEMEIADLQPEVRDYEPRLALTGQDGAAGAQGVSLHSLLLEAARGRLTPHGAVLLEVGQGQADEVVQIARQFNYLSVEAIKDYGGIERVICARLSSSP